MATIPRKFIMTSRAELHNIDPISGQIIGLWDNDEVYYDVPSDGTPDGRTVRRKISGVRIVPSLPEDPMTDIVYVYLGDDNNPEYLPIDPQSQTQQRLYELYIYKDNTWVNVSNNTNDINVMTVEADVSGSTKYYLTFTSSDTNYDVATLSKVTGETSGVYLQGDTLVAPKFSGKASDAAHADTADDATNATYDSSTPKKKINSYIHDMISNASPSAPNLGSTITYTRGDGTTGSIRVTDTTYNEFTSSTPGIVPKASTISAQPSSVILTSVGWKNASDIVMPAADSAAKDGLGQNIADTYIKGLSWNSGTLTITAGDGDTSTISVPDTTYSVFTTSTDGLVPKASGTGDTAKFLRGDHTWANVPNYTGATSGSAGVAGLVPPAASGDTAKYLKSDGTWGTVFTQGVAGLVPGATTSDPAYTLRADGTWDVCPDTKNTAGSANNTASMLYLVGAANQDSNGVQTYSNANVFINGNKLYSYSTTDSTSVEVVTLSDTQALTNKTYNSYTLGDACAATKSTTIPNAGDNDKLPTNEAVRAYINTVKTAINNDLDYKVSLPVVAPIYDATATYAIGDYCMYDDGNGAKLYKCNTAITTAEAFNSAHWDNLTVTDIDGKWLSGTLTAGSTSITLSDASITTSSHIEVWADNGNANYTSITTTTGSVTITFLAQASNMTVEVRVF